MRHIAAFLVFCTILLSVPSVSIATSPDLFQQLTAIQNYVEYLSVAPELSTSQTQEIILRSRDWFVAAQEENGHFSYEYEPFEDMYRHDDNMIRQAGSLFMLSEIYRRQSERDEGIEAAIERSIAYFSDLEAVGVTDEGITFGCVRSSEKGSKCSLGTASLALIGILNYVSTVDDKKSQYAPFIERLAHYIIASRISEHGFSGGYDLEDGFSKKESPFYNGEAMLALVRYYQYQPDELVKEQLEEVFAYLSVQESYETPLYLWIMAALKEMQQLWPQEAYVQYAYDFTTWRLERSIYKHSTTHNYCAPVEGYTSAYSILKGKISEAELTRLHQEITFWLNKTAGLQLRAPQPYRVVTVNGNLQFLQLKNPEIADGGFLTGETELTQRIDFTQHCASAYLQKLIDIDGEEL